MTVTNHYYGGTVMGAGKTIPDFGLCDLKGNYLITSRLRAKGLLLAVFFNPEQAASVNVLKAVNGWAGELEQAKWTALAVADGPREALAAFAEANQLDKLTIVVDYELYQTHTWGLSHIPSTFLIAGKGQILRRVIGDDASELGEVKALLAAEVAKIVAAEEAAKEAAARKAEEDKKAAEAAAAAKATEPAPAKA
jgi:peroxiredoxin